MTRVLPGEDIARRINERFPEAAIRSNPTDVWIKPESILEVARFLKETPGLEFSFLTSVTAVDFIEYFELVYRLLSMKYNHSIVLKAQCPGRGEPTVPSVVSVWKGADFQEREVWDLMGIRFEGHPNLKRIMLWEGFPGHPLRKDYLGQEQDYMSGDRDGN